MRHTSWLQQGRLTAGLVLVWAAVVSCVGLQRRQGWDASRGPVIPHDTFPADCALCHVSQDWHTLRDDFTYDHAAETGVPLTGAHAAAACLRCHNDRGPVAAFAAKGCAGCHEDVHRGRLGHACDTCHDETTWRPRDVIARHNRTRFPLVAAHASVACFRCHAGATVGNFEGADPSCVTCHLADYQGTTQPNHAASGFSTHCQQCHVPVAWRGTGALAHPASFPLTGGHSGLTCAACHTGGVYTSLPTDCFSCHAADYQGTTNPDHAASGFSTTCQTCHTTLSWQGATFNHPASFPLTGGHGGLTCTACHTGGVYTSLPTDCFSCHAADYQGTTNPDHAASGFSTACQTCHTTLSWQGATFNHPASFPLTGGHGGLTCTACHTGGVYTSLPTDCFSCHAADYQGTTNPNHAASGFSTTCQTCHTTLSWQGATFNHPASFPLTGGHGGLSCSACHTGGVVTSLPTDCFSCHAADYQATTNPNHAASGFSTACQTCHTTLSWQGATFNHSFPITSGPHGALSCLDCHTNPANQQEFSCTHCHAHTEATMAGHHSGVSGYVWSSPSCLACHPTGRA